MRAPLVFREVAWTGILRQRRKFGVSHAKYPYRQVRREIDAPHQEDGSKNNVRSHRKDAQSEIFNGYREDRAFYQKKHRGQRHRSRADHRSHTRGNSDFHVPLPALQFVGRIQAGGHK